MIVWLVWFPVNSTPPNKLTHPVLVCSQDVLLASDPLNSFLFMPYDAKTSKTCPPHSLPSKPTSLPLREASVSQARTLHLESVSMFHFHPLKLKTSELGSTSSCLIPINFSPNSKHLYHIFWMAQQPGPKCLHENTPPQGRELLAH